MQQPNIRDQADVKGQDAHLCKADESNSNADSNKGRVADLSETDSAWVGAQKQQASRHVCYTRKRTREKILWNADVVIVSGQGQLSG